MNAEFNPERYAEDETPIFCGKPDKPPYPVAEAVICAVVFFLVMAADGFMAGASIFKSVTGENVISQVVVAVAAFCMHVVPFGAWAAAIVKKIYYAKNVTYVVTDKRATVIRSADATETETAFYRDVIGIKEIKGGLKLVLKDDKLVLKNLPDVRAVYEALTALIDKK